VTAEPNTALPRYRLETLGTLALRGSDNSTNAPDQRQQRRRLALLAVLACSEKLGRSRDQLLLFFWPDSTERKARHSLDQLLYAIRSSLGDSIFDGVNPLRLNSSVISADVIEFEKHLDEKNFTAAVEKYRGPFLDGFYLSEAKEFEDWIDTERRRLAKRYTEALEHLALDAEQRQDHAAAIHWRQKLVDTDPVSTRYAMAMANALAKAGDFAAALAFADRYERTASRELGAENLPDIRKAIREITDRTGASSSSILSTAAHGLRQSGSEEQTRTLKADTPRPTQRRNFSIWVLVTSVLLVTLIAAFMNSSRNANAARIPAAEPPSARHSARNGTRNLAAYELYNRGQDPVLLRSDSGAKAGLDYFTKAVELDPKYASAYAGLGEMYERQGMSNHPALPIPELERLAEAAARKAIALDDSIAEGHAALGMIESHDLIDLNDGEKQLKRAIALDPSDPRPREYLALTLSMLGRADEGLKDAQDAVKTDPLSPTARATVAQVLYMLDRCDEALPILDKLTIMKPPPLRVAVARSVCLSRQQKWAEAEDAVRANAARGDIQAMGMLGFALAKDGKTREAMDLRSKLQAMTRVNPNVYYEIAIVSYGLGHIDDAIANLDRAEQFGHMYFELFGPAFTSLQADPRFKPLVGKRGVRLASRKGLG
jgi:DNA-binding SARP family transcriptional activator/Flp pilus assembly protein TadD